MPAIIPWMRYDDADAAIEWLCRVFGCREHFVVRDEAGGVAHAQLSFGDGLIMVGERTDPTGRVRRPSEVGFVTQGIYAVLDDVEGLHERVVAAGAEIVTELTTTDYGSTDFAALDLGGHLWNFGTYRPDDVTGDA